MWLFCEFLTQSYPMIPADERKLEWDSVCERYAGPKTADIEKQHSLTVQIWRESLSSHPPACLSSSGFHAEMFQRLLISLFAQQFTTDSTFYAKLARGQVSVSGERNTETVTRGDGRGAGGRQWDESTLYRARSQHRDKHHLEARECCRHREPEIYHRTL